jgi:hypothetical protein
MRGASFGLRPAVFARTGKRPQERSGGAPLNKISLMHMKTNAALRGGIEDKASAMKNASHLDLDNDGTNLVITVNSGAALSLTVAVSWHQIAQLVAQEIRATFSRDDIMIHFVDAADGLRIRIRDVTEDWIDRFDPEDSKCLQERKVLVSMLHDCLSRIEDCTGALSGGAAGLARADGGEDLTSSAALGMVGRATAGLIRD